MGQPFSMVSYSTANDGAGIFLRSRRRHNRSQRRLAGLAVLAIMNIYNDFLWPVVVASSSRMATLQFVLSTSVKG